MSILFDRVKHMADGAMVIREWLGEGGIAVSPEQAQARATTCIGCPHNMPGNPITDVVAKAIRRHLEIKNRGLKLRVNGESSLAECDLCGCQLRLKIWTPIEVIRKRMNKGEAKKLPEFCWQITEP